MKRLCWFGIHTKPWLWIDAEDRTWWRCLGCKLRLFVRRRSVPPDDGGGSGLGFSPNTNALMRLRLSFASRSANRSQK